MNYNDYKRLSKFKFRFKINGTSVDDKRLTVSHEQDSLAPRNCTQRDSQYVVLDHDVSEQQNQVVLDHDVYYQQYHVVLDHYVPKINNT